MRQFIYVLYDEETECVAKRVYDNASANKLIKAAELTEDVLLSIANKCFSEYFYVIKTHKEICFESFRFNFSPEQWDNEYVHIWNNDTLIRLFHRDTVMSDPSAYTDAALVNGTVKLKNINESIFSYPVFDIVFLSYDELAADVNYTSLKSRFPRAVRVSGIKGIYEAHKAAAELVNTDMFYVVDADAEVVETFDFSYQPHSTDLDSVHVWHSRNPVNGLEYGYGGIKLFPTSLLLSYDGSPVDFTTSVSKGFKVIPEVSNITRFDTDPFSAWRSGFRECAKLSSRIIHNQQDCETEERLRVWLNEGANTEFGSFVLMGAKAGAAFGKEYANQPNMLGLINDFSWLEKQFSL